MKRKINNLSIEEKLVIYLSYINHNEKEKSLIKNILGQSVKWEKFIKLATFNKTIPISYDNLKRLGLIHLIPDHIKKIMDREYEKIKKQNEDRINEAKRFLQRFHESGIPVALIKGVCYGEAIYDNPYYKRMNDIDILIKKENTEKIYEIYDDLDYFFIGERINGSREKSDKINHVAPAYISRDMKCVIGTQWGIKTPLSPCKINYDNIWKRMRKLDFYGLPLAMMSPEDNLHHLCLHLGYFKIAVRDLMDLYNLLRFYKDDFDWKLFADIVKESKSENVVYHALKVSSSLCPNEDVEDYLSSIKRKVSKAYIKGSVKKIQNLSVLLRMCTDHIQSIEKSIGIFDVSMKMSEKWSSFLYTWRLVIFPPYNDLKKMAAIPKSTLCNKIIMRLSIPFKILWVIAGEVGWNVLFLLSFKMFLDLMKTTFSAPFSKKPQKSIEEQAQNIGLKPEQIQLLLNHFQ